MTGDETAQLAYASLAVMLVASSLFARRLPLGQTLKMILAWIAIFAAAFVLFSYRHVAKSAWQHMKSEIVDDGAVTENGTLRIRKSDDGHFWVKAQINGHTQRLLIDSGATTTSISTNVADASGVEVSKAGFPVIIDTANGTTQAWRAEAQSLVVGPIRREQFNVLVSDSFGDTNVIGMNFLSTLKSWRVEGDEMVLNP